jgi:hypothetical protein
MFSHHVLIKILGFRSKGTGFFLKNIGISPKGTSFLEGDKFLVGVRGPRSEVREDPLRVRVALSCELVESAREAKTGDPDHCCAAVPDRG